MIRNFDKLTYEITEHEIRVILPEVKKILLTSITEDRAIKNRQIVEMLTKHDLKLTDVRLRKIIHHIRVNHIVTQLIASSKGYFRTDDPHRIRGYIDSLDQRISSISDVRNALTRDLSIIPHGTQTKLDL